MGPIARSRGSAAPATSTATYTWAAAQAAVTEKILRHRTLASRQPALSHPPIRDLVGIKQSPFCIVNLAPESCPTLRQPLRRRRKRTAARSRGAAVRHYNDIVGRLTVSLAAYTRRSVFAGMRRSPTPDHRSNLDFRFACD